MPDVSPSLTTLPAALRHAAASQRVVAIDSQEFVSMINTGVDAARLEAATADVQPDDLAMVIYTSGTTGRTIWCSSPIRSTIFVASA